ncbi:MAG: class I SAM-dependent methyltransferase [Candidatus Poribacteria bacterium]|nr:class I SAM-dependent methyltransferase [Candidatus Poribacteria bacterium]
MSDRFDLDALNRTTIEYYHKRPILGDKGRPQPWRPPTPEWEEEDAVMIKALQSAMKGRRVLEVACGSGQRTRFVAPVAEYVLATEIDHGNLEWARTNLQFDNVEYLQCDAFDLAPINGKFDVGFVGGFFHIVPQARYDAFLSSFHEKLSPGSVVFMYSSSGDLTKVDKRLFRKKGLVDRYCRRELSDGSVYEIVDNDFDEQKLKSIFEPRAENIDVHVGRYMWWMRYVLPCH